MTFTVEAMYENGVLRPEEPLPLKEREKVEVIIRTGTRTPSALAVASMSEQQETLARLFSLELPVADWEQMEQEIIRGAVNQ